MGPFGIIPRLPEGGEWEEWEGSKKGEWEGSGEDALVKQRQSVITITRIKNVLTARW